MRSLKTLILLATIGLNNALDRYYVNDAELKTVTIPCTAQGVDLIKEHGLYLVHWFRIRVDSRSNTLFDEDQQKIIERRVDDDDVNNIQIDHFQSDPLTGALTITKGSNDDGTIGPSDQAQYICRLLYGVDGTQSLDHQTLLVVTSLPPDGEREPDLIDIQPSQDPQNNINYVYNMDFSGNLVTCQTGHAMPTPEIKWEVWKGDDKIKTLEASVGILSDNPLILDDDDTDQFHAAELPLTLYTQDQGGLSPEYDDTHYKCVVTYELAVDGLLTKKSYTTSFPESKKDKIHVMHPVSKVDLRINSEEAPTDFIDLCYDNEYAVSCIPDGYDPSMPVGAKCILSPSAEDINRALQTIKAEKKRGDEAKVEVTMTAKNSLNDDNVVKTRTLVAIYIDEITEDSCTREKGPRKKDGETFSCKTPAASSGTPIVLIYPQGLTKGLTGKQEGNKNDVDEKILEIEQGKACNVGDNTCSGELNDPYFVVTKLPGQDVQRLYHSKTHSSRSQVDGKADINEVDAPFWEMPKDDTVKDPKKIRFWRNSQDETGVKFVEITTNTKDMEYDYPENKSTGNTIRRQLPTPSGGQYVVCYDLGDASDDIKKANGLEWTTAANQIVNTQEDYCTFFNVPIPSTGGLWWLWIIIIIILLIIIAAIVWWIKQKQAAGGDEEDPTLKASQIPGAGDENAGDEFAIEQETTEASPMINNDDQQEQQQSSRTDE